MAKARFWLSLLGNGLNKDFNIFPPYTFLTSLLYTKAGANNKQDVSRITEQ